MRQKRRNKKPQGWTNKGFHLSLFLLLTLFTFALAGAKSIGSEMQHKLNTPAIAKDEQPLVTPITKPTPTPKPLPTPLATTKWEEFKRAAREIAKIYNYPANVIIAQCALESARGTSNFAIERNNFCGIGAVDWDPGQAFKFENAQDCVIEYIRLVRRNFPEAYMNKEDPNKVLYYLKHNSDGVVYATDPDYITKVMSQPEWSEK